MNGQEPVVYLLDSNVFIEAHRRYYAFGICPGFWDCLAHYCQAPRLLSIDRVRQEIREGDALDAWIRDAPEELFASTADADVVQAFAESMTWVNASAQFRTAAKEEYARVADGWVVAYARVHGMTVVTHERFDPEIRKSVPIPNVCRQYGIAYKNTFDTNLHSR